jgi:tetratricopeptide (TPR) repeat protein
MERLAKTDPGNATWQHDLALFFSDLGGAQLKQGKLQDALQSYRASLAILERITLADPNDIGWQIDLALAHNSVGNVQVKQGKLGDALASYTEQLAIA